MRVSSLRTFNSGEVSLPFTRRITAERFCGEKTSVDEPSPPPKVGERVG